MAGGIRAYHGRRWVGHSNLLLGTHSLEVAFHIRDVWSLHDALEHQYDVPQRDDFHRGQHVRGVRGGHVHHDV